MIEYVVGQKVRTLRQITEGPSECMPYRVLSSKGEMLIVRDTTPGRTFPIQVSHESITDQSFGVTSEEITPIT